MKFTLKKYNRRTADQELIDDVKAVAKKLGKGYVTKTDYFHHAQFGVSTLLRRFRSWSAVSQLAGLQPGKAHNIDKELLFKNLEEVWVKLGRQPIAKEMKYPQSQYSVRPYLDRFCTWENALGKFIGYQNRKSPGSAQIQKRIRICRKEGSERNKKMTGNSREVPLEVRFRVYVRDGFRCTACGASPITQQGVALHCDHIKPWSRGGRTVVRNLQTLCSDCNLKKGSKMGKEQVKPTLANDEGNVD